MKNESNIQQFIINKSKITFASKMKERLFSVVDLLSKSKKMLSSVEKISTIFQSFQFLVFALNQNFAPLWKQPFLFEHIRLVIRYFQIVPFFENNQSIYLLAFYTCSVFFIALIAVLVYYFVSGNQKENSFTNFLCMTISAMSLPFYIPILILFTSILSCNDKKNTYVPEMTCWSGIYFLHAGMGILMAILFTLFSYLFVSLDISSESTSADQANMKTTSASDVRFLFGKTLLVLLYTFFNTIQEDQHWIVIVGSLCIAMFIFSDYYYRRPFLNVVMMKFYFAMTSLFLWSNACLLLGKLLEKTPFDGLLQLFLVGVPIIIIFISTSEPPNFELLIHQQTKRGDDMLHSILSILMIIETKEKVRRSEILFEGYVSLCEERCLNSQCALKKFLNSKSSDINERKGYLYQHIESLFSSSIIKQPTSALLRISFAFFLLIKMNKKNKALVELANAEKYCKTLQDNFKIYKYKAMILNFELLSTIDLTEEVKDTLEYKRQYNAFKNLIKKVALHYIDFWGILLLSDQENKDNLEKLNEIGKTITQTASEIDEKFEMLQRMKYNERETIICYSDFLMNVINDKDKASQLRSSVDSIRDTNQSFQGEIYNLNANSLSYSDETQYFVVSSQTESFGVIMNISLGLCSLFGYSKHEVIGKSYECLLPDVFIKQHRQILESKAEALRKNMSNYYNYKEIHTQRHTFAINKARYLIPVHVTVGIIPNELNDYSFIAKIVNLSEQSLMMNSIDCFVLTNNDLIIQHFTPNSIACLDIDSRSINSTIEITEYIKEFNEDFLNLMVDLEDKTPERKLSVKLTVLRQKYSVPTIIVWKRNKKDGSERQLKMKITEQKLHNLRFGFIFQFEQVKEMSGSNMPSFKSLKPIKENSHSLIGKLEKEFIPESNFKFNLDPITMSYQWHSPNANANANANANSQTDTHTKYVSHLQALALKKFNFNQTTYDSTHSNDQSESYSQSNDNTDSVDNNSNDEDQCDEESSKDDRGINEKPVTRQKDDSYYKVSCNRIKFFMIDYKKQAFIEEEDYDKTSQIELKMDDNYKDKDTASPSDTKQMQRDSKGKQEMIANQISDETGKESHHLSDQNEIVLKQIESALNLKESQPTIIRLQQVTFGVILFLLGIGAGFIAVLMISYDDIQETSLTIQNTFDIVIIMIKAQYYVRQISFLNNEYFNNSFTPKEERFKAIQNSIFEIFNVSVSKINQIVTTKMTMSEEAQYIFNTKTIPVYILQDDADFSVKSFELNIKAAFIEANTALFHITTGELKEMIPTHKDMHFFARNGVNEIFNEMNTLHVVLLKELNINLYHSKIRFSIPFAISPVLLLVSYFLLNHYHQAVSNRKDSYLEVFFKIGKAIIQSSLENCEYFNKKIQNDSMSDTISGDDPSDFNNIEINQIESNPVNAQVSSLKKKMSQLTKETRLIKTKIAAIMVVLMAYFILVFTFFIDYLNTIATLFLTYQNALEYQINNCLLINYMREYFFDPTMPCYSVIPGTRYLDIVLTKAYSLMKKNELLITSNIELYDESFVELYNSLNEGNICYYGEKYFLVSNKTCDTFLNGAAKYGLKVLLSAFIEDIRYLLNLNNIDEQTRIKEKLYYNLTLYGTPAFTKGWPTEEEDPDRYNRYLEYMPIKTVNHIINNDIISVYLFFLSTSYNRMTEDMKKNIETFLLNFKIIFLSVLVCYLGIACMFYMFVMIPFIQGLNQTVSIFI